MTHETMTTPDLIARVKELDEKATKGPWQVAKSRLRIEDTEGKWILDALASESNLQISLHNTQYAAESRTLLPEVTRRLEACLKAMPDPDKLRMIADMFDAAIPNDPNPEIQTYFRKCADDIAALTGETKGEKDEQ
jgi:hypothetical protein